MCSRVLFSVKARVTIRPKTSEAMSLDPGSNLGQLEARRLEFRDTDFFHHRILLDIDDGQFHQGGSDSVSGLGDDDNGRFVVEEPVPSHLTQSRKTVVFSTHRRGFSPTDCHPLSSRSSLPTVSRRLARVSPRFLL